MPGLNLALAKNKNRDGAEPAKETSRVAMTNNDTLVDDGYSFLGNDYGAEIENENNENPKGEGKGLWAGKFKKKAAEKTTKEPEAEPKASTETTLQKPAPGTKTPYPSKGMSTFVAKKPSVLHNPTLAAQTPKPATKPSFFKSAPNGSTKNVVTPGTTAVKANRHKVTFRLPNKEDPKAAVPEPALQPMETEGMDIDKPDPPAPTLTTESIIDGMNDMAVDKKNADTDETFVDSASATTESFESEFIQAEEEEEEDDASQPYVMVDHDDFDLIHEEFLLLARDCKDRSKAFESALLDMQVDLTLANTSTLMARTEGQELARRLEDAAAQMAESMDQATELLASIMHM